MKKYRHKPTGIVLSQSMLYEDYYGGNKYSVHKDIVQSGLDWEEIKPELEVPPGIVSFKTSFGSAYHQPDQLTYNLWVETALNSNFKIHSIKVNDTIWEVGEITERGKIDEIQWRGGGWMTRFGNTWLAADLNCKKRKPIVNLQGKDIYEGDMHWAVHKRKFTFEDYITLSNQIWNYNDWEFFSTKELADQYIRDNKPVYPAGLVEDLIGMAERNFHILAGKCQCNTAPIIDKLKAFKK